MASNRYLVVAALPDVIEAGTWRILTAREMTEGERKGYQNR